MNPRPLPPNLYHERNRHGTLVFYVRVGKGKRVRVRGEFGSEEFAASYQVAIMGHAPRKRSVAAKDTLGWLIATYHDSAAWTRLAVATRRQREGIFKRLLAEAGDVSLDRITAQKIREGIDRRRATPFAANMFLVTLKVLFRWGCEQGHIETDPTLGLRSRGQKSEGFHTWTDEEIARYEAWWGVGTTERLAFAILLWTGLRRGDAAMLGRQHIRDGVITFRTEKTGQQVTIPLLPELARVIEATPTGDLTFIVGKDGRPMPKGSFGHWFAAACKAAGVPGRAHGLRKAGATRAANNGATVAQLEAIFGWSGGQMASHYTRKADRKKLAMDAMEKLRK